MLAAVGRRKGFKASPLQKLGGQRNWDKAQVENCCNTLQRLSNKAGMNLDLSTIRNNLLVFLDLRYEADKAAIKAEKEQYNGASKEKEVIGLDNPVYENYLRNRE